MCIVYACACECVHAHRACSVPCHEICAHRFRVKHYAVSSANVALKHTINLCLYFYTLTLFSDMMI